MHHRAWPCHVGEENEELMHVRSSTMSMIQDETLLVKNITAGRMHDDDDGEWAGSLVTLVMVSGQGPW